MLHPCAKRSKSEKIFVMLFGFRSCRILVHLLQGVPKGLFCEKLVIQNGHRTTNHRAGTRIASRYLGTTARHFGPLPARAAVRLKLAIAKRISARSLEKKCVKKIF